MRMDAERAERSLVRRNSSDNVRNARCIYNLVRFRDRLVHFLAKPEAEEQVGRHITVRDRCARCHQRVQDGRVEDRARGLRCVVERLRRTVDDTRLVDYVIISFLRGSYIVSTHLPTTAVCFRWT